MVLFSAMARPRIKPWRAVRFGLAAFREYNTFDFLCVRNVVKGYTAFKARNDFKAGLNVALLAFPQGMAYAVIAGLPIYYGLFGSAVAAIVGPMVSGSRFIVLGPTNATAVLLFGAFLNLGMAAEEKVAMMPLLVAMVGIFLIVGAFLKVAHLVQYISRTVVIGYITAAAFYIILNQIRNVLGVDFDMPAGTTFFGVIKLTLLNLGDTHYPSLFLGLITLAAYGLLNRRYRALPNVAITLVFISVVAWLLNSALGTHSLEHPLGGPVRLLDAVDAGSWMLTLPPLNHEWISKLAGVALTIAFLAVLEGTSIGKSLAARSGERLDTNQEMLGMGAANIGCGLLSGMPASGSLTRSQLNWSSGAETAFASVFCGLLCVVGALVFGSLIRFIPEPALGVLVIVIGISLINRHTIRVVVKTTRSDAVVFGTTFLAALLVRLDFAIILGAATSILLFLRKAATPELVEYVFTEEGHLAQLEDRKRPDPEVSIVHVEGDLFFGAAELFRDQMRRVVEDPNLKIVILKMRHAHHLDATSVLALDELIRYMREHDRYLLVSEVRKIAIRIFRNSGLIEVIGRENIFPDVTSNPVYSTAKALKRARDIIGHEKAKVSIYVDPAKEAK